MASAPDQVDITALLERLREELRWGANGASDVALRTRARTLAEQSWPVTAERPPQGNAAARFAKRLVRKLMRWYVEPFAQQQRSYNDALLKLIDELFEHVDRLRAERDASARLADELEERLLRMERRGTAPPAAATVAPQPAAATVPDYFAFESRMRGPTSLVRERQRPYLDDFRDQGPVLDVGCGRGEFLQLLREAGIEGRGVDADADMAAYARGEGLDIEQGDALAYLQKLEDGSLGGVFAAQVVEHLPPPALLRLLELARAKLRPGGLLVAETINPLSPIALRNYWADLTHAQPLVPETLALLARQAGFREVETRFLNAPERPPELEGPVAEILFAPLDYAILARA